MPKYSLDFKIKVVKEYLDGKSGGRELVSKKFNIPNSTLENWINWFNIEGIEGLMKKHSNDKYSGEFKLSVIKYRQINNLSYRETAEHFNIRNASMVASWTKKYEEEGFSGLNKTKGRPRKDMSKEKKSNQNNSLNETEREELIRLREEVKYLKLKEIYEKKLQALLWKEELEARKRQK